MSMQPKWILAVLCGAFVVTLILAGTRDSHRSSGPPPTIPVLATPTPPNVPGIGGLSN